MYAPCSALSNAATTLAVLLVVAYTATGQTEPQSISDFKVPEYNEKMQLESMLFGDHADVSREGNVVDITNLRIEYYKVPDPPLPPDQDDPNPEIEMRITAPHCTFDRRYKAASSEGKVRITNEDMAVTGENFNFKVDTEHLVIKKNVKVVLRNVRRSNELMKLGDDPAPDQDNEEKSP